MNSNITITKGAGESIGYKTWKNRKWLRTWNEGIQRTVEEKKLATGNIYKTKQWITIQN